MYYELHNYANGDEFISENSNIDFNNLDFEEIWTTNVPFDFKKNEDRVIPKPYRFNNKNQAKLILDAIKNARLIEYEKNKYYYKITGGKKPSWKIYKIDNE